MSTRSDFLFDAFINIKIKIKRLPVSDNEVLRVTFMCTDTVCLFVFLDIHFFFVIILQQTQLIQ